MVHSGWLAWTKSSRDWAWLYMVFLFYFFLFYFCHSVEHSLGSQEEDWRIQDVGVTATHRVWPVRSGFCGGSFVFPPRFPSRICGKSEQGLGTRAERPDRTAALGFVSSYVRQWLAIPPSFCDR